MLMRDPPLPGGIIRRKCLQPLESKVTEAVTGLGVSRNTLSMLLYGRLGISPEMAIRFSQAFQGGEPGKLVASADAARSLACAEAPGQDRGAQNCNRLATKG